MSTTPNDPGPPENEATSAENALVRINANRTIYDPSTVGQTGPLRKKLLEHTHQFKVNGDWYETVRLTAMGNTALRQLCHTEDQKAVWRFPAYPFTVRRGAISVEQVSTLLLFFIIILTLLVAYGTPILC
jgi:hypothetical protein